MLVLSDPGCCKVVFLPLPRKADQRTIELTGASCGSGSVDSVRAIQRGIANECAGISRFLKAGLATGLHPVPLVELSIIEHPSVPLDSFQLAPQQVSCVGNGFDLSMTSFPLMCLSPDGSRLCPSNAESIPSVPSFSLALSRSNTTSIVQETLSSQLDILSFSP